MLYLRIRNTHAKILLIVCLFFTVVPGAFSQQAEPRSLQLIEWQPVAGASFYRLTFYQGDEFVYEADTEDPFLEIILPPGSYRYNIAVFNKFEKLASQTGWLPFVIKPAYQPLILWDDSDILFYFQANGDFRMETVIENLRPESVVSLHKDVESFPAEIISKGGNSYELVFPGLYGQSGEGAYSLSIMNPSGLNDRIAVPFMVKMPLIPAVQKIIPSALTTDVPSIGIRIEGSGFENGVVVLIEGEDDIVPEGIVRVSENVLTFNCDLTGISPGAFSVLIENPSGGSVFIRNALAVISPESRPQEVREIVETVEASAEEQGIEVILPEEENPEETAETEQIITSGRRAGWHNKISGITLGYKMSFADGGLSEFFPQSFLGGSAGVRLSFKNDFAMKAPFLRQMAMEAALGYIYYENNDVLDGSYVLDHWSLDLALLYKTPFVFFLNLVIRGGLGVTNSSLNGEGLIGDLDTSSLDFHFVAGAALELSIGQRFFLETGCNMRFLFTEDEMETYLEPYGVLGVYLH